MKHSTGQSKEESREKPLRPFVPAWVRNILPNLKGVRLAVLIAYWSRANKDGLAWPSIQTLARDTGYGELAVKRGRKALVEMGFLLPVEQYRDTNGRWKKKVFRVCTMVSKASYGTAGCFSSSTAGFFSHSTAVSKESQEGIPGFRSNPKGRSGGSAPPHRGAPSPVKGGFEKQEEKPYKAEVPYV